MASIRMKTVSAGPEGVRLSGSVYPVTPDEGRRLVRGGFADWVEPPRENVVEVAVKPSPENAALRTKAPAKKAR